jgi:L-threonylcarbamoyladenylate synthase
VIHDDRPFASEIDRAAAILREGGLVAFPTETVYGLGASCLDVRALARVFEVKGRPRFDPLIVHVPDAASARALVESFPDRAERLAEQFWPGPLTLVLRKRPIVPDLATAGLPTVGVRVPAHPVALELLKRAAIPIAAPSANPFGAVSPTCALHVREQLGERIDFVLDGGPCPVGIESTVVAVSESGWSPLRPGGTTIEEIASLIGPAKNQPSAATESSSFPRPSPGMLARHYAPRTPLVVFDPGAQIESLDLRGTAARAGLICLRPPGEPGQFAAVEALSHSGDLREAAARFFAALRRLDAAGLDLIVAEPFPEEGLGLALNDRLRRAAHR